MQWRRVCDVRTLIASRHNIAREPESWPICGTPTTNRLFSEQWPIHTDPNIIESWPGKVIHRGGKPLVPCSQENQLAVKAMDTYKVENEKTDVHTAAQAWGNMRWKRKCLLVCRDSSLRVWL
ncbi:hypothetical protein DdX_01696 [Ditylenchus destructor]|uniref:Uncharacterized protein n=1 Tax=Ditylenchus destructor TaxID=166010 RepID=A0AAD4RE34_9BILA|nr:hypothetical protein DdX_01696 [Ditylenchus destructor]